MKKIILAIAISIGISMSAAHAGMKHDHKNMTMNKSEATTMIKINRIDKRRRVLNVDHGEVPAFGWPAMTMDLPVSKKVNLDELKEGQKVMATLKKGRDSKFRIIKLGH
jgi:Cu/Ag efflux protein CusF